MAKYIAISIVLAMLGLISSADGIIIFFGAFLVVPFIMLFQIIFHSLFRVLKFDEKICRKASLLPAIFFLVFSYFHLSVFNAASNAFKVAMKTKKPDSVKELYAWEDSWTDYIAEIYCEIEPEDLKAIINKSRFTRLNMAKFKDKMDLSDTMITQIHNKPPLKNLVVYRSEVRRGGEFISRCTIYTNKDHNRILVKYGAN